MFRPPAGFYDVTTGAGSTPEEASAEIFPEDASIVLIRTERFDTFIGETVTYTFLVDYQEQT